MPFQEKIIDFLEELKQKKQDEMKNETSTEQLLFLFENHLVKSTKEVAEIKTQQKTDWFAQSECIHTLISEMRHIHFITRTQRTKILKD